MLAGAEDRERLELLAEVLEYTTALVAVQEAASVSDGQDSLDVYRRSCDALNAGRTASDLLMAALDLSWVLLHEVAAERRCTPEGVLQQLALQIANRRGV